MRKLLLQLSLMGCCVVSGVGSLFLPSSGESLEAEMNARLNENDGNDNNADKGAPYEFVAKDSSYTGPKRQGMSSGCKGCKENKHRDENDSQSMGVEGYGQGTPKSSERIEKHRRLQVTPPPTMAPSKSPTMAPSKSPTMAPSKAPTMAPSTTKSPTMAPSKSPTMAPSKAPTMAPSTTKSPTMAPSTTKSPTMAPSKSPSMAPSKAPTMAPSKAPTMAPSFTRFPTKSPTMAPTETPSGFVRRFEGGKKGFTLRTSRAAKAPKAPKNVFTFRKKF